MATHLHVSLLYDRGCSSSGALIGLGRAGWMGSLLLWKDLISGFPTAGKCLKQRGSSDKGFVVGVEFNLLSEEGLKPHCYKRSGKRRQSRRAGRQSLDCTCLPKMEQNGTKENGRSEENPASGPPQPVHVQDIRFTKVNGRQVTCGRRLHTSAAPLNSSTSTDLH